jgi:hypothetical protein
MQRIPLLPWSNSLISSKGIVIALDVPSYHQTDYHTLFSSLRNQKGVSELNPIMTVSMKAGKLMTEITEFYSEETQSWIVPSELVDLSGFISDFLE